MIDESKREPGPDTQFTVDWVAAFKVLLISGILISAICTAPQYLGSYLARWLGLSGDPQTAQLCRVSLNSAAVILGLFVCKGVGLLRFERPARPLCIGFLLPLAALNFLRGPLVDDALSVFALLVVSIFLTAFWEEFLFRGLVQERLRVLGPRIGVVVTAALFSVIHAYAGWDKVYIAFAIGLSFGVLRTRVGIWPLIAVHFAIDFARFTLVKEWSGHNTLADYTIAAYLIFGCVMLIRIDRWPPRPLPSDPAFS